MVKFPLIVFSLALILSIQFIVSLKYDEIQAKLSEKEEYAMFYLVFQTILESLINAGLVDRNVTQSKVAQVEFYEAYEKAKEKQHPSPVEVSLEDEKQLFYVTLEYAIEMMASSELIDHDVVYNKLFLGKAKTLASMFDEMVTQAIENARTNDKDSADNLKAKSKGKDKARSKGKDDDNISKPRSKGKDNARSDDKDDTDNSKGRSKRKDNARNKGKDNARSDEKDETDNPKARSKGKDKADRSNKKDNAKDEDIL